MPTLAVSVSHFAALKQPAVPSVTELVALGRKGDQEAFFRLFSIHEKRVYAFCYRLLKDVPEAESLTREIFLVAFRRLKDLRDDAAFSDLISRSLCEAVLKFRRASHDTLSSPGELAASNLPATSAAPTQLGA